MVPGRHRNNRLFPIGPPSEKPARSLLLTLHVHGSDFQDVDAEGLFHRLLYLDLVRLGHFEDGLSLFGLYF